MIGCVAGFFEAPKRLHPSDPPHGVRYHISYAHEPSIAGGGRGGCLSDRIGRVGSRQCAAFDVLPKRWRRGGVGVGVIFRPGQTRL